MARSRSSLMAVVLFADALLLGSWCISAAFVSAPATRAEPSVRFLAPAAAAAAAMLPAGAQAVERWTYQEPNADGLTVEQIQVFLWFVLTPHRLADFYAKKIGAGPAIPVIRSAPPEMIRDSCSSQAVSTRGPTIALVLLPAPFPTSEH
ncbi:unnamed protein product [Polarella glacialis]|uniref:Uncharacterized protein n=1 Tax=Polarella glacialis TaxID=89957 RepID=A0A813L7S4_POLGL|nr:unnamed protein product [Polarella glacialis]